MNENKEKTLAQMNSLRGIFALEIIVGHVVRHQSGVLYPLGKFMICSVAFFFFVSAFGLVMSYQKKENYLSAGFLKNKVLYLFLLAVTMYIINNLIDFALKDYPLNYNEQWYTIDKFFTATNWYIWQQMLFYIIFFVCYKYLEKYRVVAVSLVTLLLPVLFYYMGMPEGWCASSFAFAFGIIAGEYYDKVKKFIDSFAGKFVVLLLAVFGCCSLFVKNETLLSIVFMRNAICIASIVVMVYVAQIEFLGNNLISKFTTKYSLELYLSQFVWLRLINKLSLNYWTSIFVVLLLTVITAVLLHWPAKLIRRITR